MGKKEDLLEKYDITDEELELNEISDYIKINEGINWKVENDVKGNPTIGRGHKVLEGEDLSYLDKLDKKQKKVEFDRIFEKDVKKKMSKSKDLFPQFDNYPIDLKKALVDGVYRGDHRWDDEEKHETVKAINESRWKDVPENYIDRDDYRDSRASEKEKDKSKRWTGVYKRLDKNNKIFKKYAGADSLIDKGQKDFMKSSKKVSSLMDYVSEPAYADDGTSPELGSQRKVNIGKFAWQDKQMEIPVSEGVYQALQKYKGWTKTPSGQFFTGEGLPEGQYGEQPIPPATRVLETVATIGMLGTLGTQAVQDILFRVKFNADLQGKANIIKDLPTFEAALKSVGIKLPSNMDAPGKVDFLLNLAKNQPTLGKAIKASSLRPAAVPAPKELANMVRKLGGIDPTKVSGYSSAISGLSNASEVIQEGGQSIRAIARKLVKEGKLELQEGEKPADALVKALSLTEPTPKETEKGFNKDDIVLLGDMKGKVTDSTGDKVSILTEAGKTIKMPVDELNSLGVENLTDTPKTPVSKPEVAKTPIVGGEVQPTDLTQEAKKYKTAEEFFFNQVGKGKHEVIYYKIGSNNIEIIKNPTASDVRQIDKEFKKDFPLAKGEPSIRTTYDDKGNKYIFRSDKSTHGDVEPFLRDKFGVELSQDNWQGKKYLTDIWTKAQEAPKIEAKPIKYARVPGGERAGGINNLSASVSQKEIDILKQKVSAKSQAAEGGFKAGIRAQRKMKKTKEDIGKAISGLMRVNNANVPQEYRNAIDDSLSELGIGKYKRPLKSKRKLREFIEEQKLKGEIVGISDEDVALADATTLENATLELLQNKLDVLKQVATLGRNEKRLLSDFSKQDYEKTITNIVDSIYKTRRMEPTPLDDTPKLPSQRKKTSMDNAKNAIDSYFSHHWKTEMIAIVLDGGKPGPVHEGILEPIQQGSDREMIRNHEDYQDVIKAIDKYTPEETQAMLKDSQEILPGRPMTKIEAITVYINSKNPSNRERLTDGWKFTDDQIKAIENSLTPKDKRFAKELMDVAGKRWKESNDVVKAITGLDMGKVKDYFPISTDKEIDTQAKLREAQRNLFEDVFKRTSVQRGHTKSRVGGKAPVDLSGIDVLLKHIQRTNKFASVGKEVRDVQKIINDPRFKQAVVDTMGENIYNQFAPWLRDFANPRSHFMDEAESLAAVLKHRATSSILGLKVSVSLLQGGSLTQTINVIGLPATMRGVKEFWKDPAKALEFMYSVDPQMRFRSKYFDRDLKEYLESSGAVDFMKGKGDSLSFVFSMIQGVDKLTTAPSWLGAYLKALSEPGATQESAVKYARYVVRTTQPAGGVKDLAAIARGSKFKKLWTMFYTFFSTYQNQMFRQWDYIRHGDAPTGEKLVNSAVAYWWLMIVPATLATFVRSGGKAKPKDYVKGVAGHATSGLIGVRDIANLALRDFGTDVTSPGLSGLKEGGAVLRDVRRKAEGKEVKGKKFLEHSIKLGGYATGLPTAQGWITLDGLMDLSSGQTKDLRRLFWSKYALGEGKEKKPTSLRERMNKKYGGSSINTLRKRMNEKYGTKRR